MIISRTPFRVSFFGGGTDFPGYFREHGGAVISSTIDKYCYLSVHQLTSFFKHRCRASYSKTELVGSSADFKHPLIRETLLHLNIHEGVEIVHVADLPGQTGLGSSSSFTVGLLNALYGFKKERTLPADLAAEAIHIERDRVQDAGGWQDQYAAAYGGFNKIVFPADKPVRVENIGITIDRIRELEGNLLMFYLGVENSAETVLKEQISKTKMNTGNLQRMHEMVNEAEDLLCSNAPLSQFGEMLHEAWERKKALSRGISNKVIDDAYSAAQAAGSIGGKLLGAGGRGFLCLYAPEASQPIIREKLQPLKEVRFKFSSEGSRIIFSSNE